MKKYLIIILALIFFAGGIVLPRDFNSEREVVFRVKRGEGLKDISSSLEKERLIWWGPFFQFYSFISGRSGSLQAGTYLFSPSMNIPQMVQKMSSGATAKARITIPEGFTSEQILERLRDMAQPNLAALKEYEGYLFPDTYEINYGAGAEEIAKMMTDNFNQKTAGLQIIPEIVIMASILEKEVKIREEKELAADILWKRLKAGMPLQVDAFMWTYEHYGLPEKPISNPGLESIESAINPKSSPYWYYLSALDGKTIFSKTLEEHNIARAIYLK